jgi:hypothetical protein
MSLRESGMPGLKTQWHVGAISLLAELNTQLRMHKTEMHETIKYILGIDKALHKAVNSAWERHVSDRT